MFDFINKFKIKWNPNEILSSEVAGNLVQEPVQDLESQQIAQTLCDHLNTIMDYQDRLASLNYLADTARSNFDDLVYTTSEEQLVNAIIQLGGKDGTVDFALIQKVINLMLEWYTVTAADSLTAKYRGMF